jgi:uncharacterized protein
LDSIKNWYLGFWHNLAAFVLKYRWGLSLAVGLLTVVFGYFALKINLSYELPKILPSTDPNFKIYESFKKKYGEDGNVMLIGVENPNMFRLDSFGPWYDLAEKIKAEKGVKNVLSVANLSTLKRNDSAKTFDLVPLLRSKPRVQSELDSLKISIEKLPFYEGFVFKDNAYLLAVTFDQKIINSKDRIDLTSRVIEIGDAYSKSQNLKVYYSGMPFIRTNFMTKVRDELVLFMALAFFVTALILFIFFKSLPNVLFASFVVLVGVVWSVGIMTLLGYQISILTGLIPPLVIVIGIPNTIFLINKYQQEYLIKKDKLEALKQTVESIGRTTFMANITTCIGFFVFYFTNSPLLSEFGLVASLGVLATWLVSMILIPTIFSVVGVPKDKHIKHLEGKFSNNLLKKIDRIVHTYRTRTYWFVAILTLVSVIGFFKIKAIGYVVDDLPQTDRIYTDLKFIEKHFKGVVPIEVNVDTKTENGVFDPVILNKIKTVQREFSKYDNFTKPISLVEGIKFIYQAYRGGDPKYYVLPPALELQKLADYFGDKKEQLGMLGSFIDAKKQMTRVSFQSADIGTVKTDSLYDLLQPKIDSIFNYDSDAESWLEADQKTEVKLTGNGIVFSKGNAYLLRNLQESSLLAILLVCMVMATQFLNFRTILISTIPSIIPLIITGGLMGYFGIPLKPSTILIFSISFGIASDGTIYFLTRYKEELKKGLSIPNAVSATIKHTGLSMIYTAIILFFGFGIFVASGFKGTFYLGLLIAITLLIGMISNLILLPCFLMTLDKKAKEKASKALA